MQGRRNGWLTKTAIQGPTTGIAPPVRQENPSISCEDTTTPEYKEAPTPAASHWCETRQLRCGLGPSPVNPTIFGREVELHSGYRKIQEAKAACRKAREIHNPADWPARPVRRAYIPKKSDSNQRR